MVAGSTAHAALACQLIPSACPGLGAAGRDSAVCSFLKLTSVQVGGLAGCRVLHVACGVWHTAAVAAQLPVIESLRQGSRDVDPAEWEAIQQKMADAYDVLDEVRALHSSSQSALQDQEAYC